MAKSDKLLRAFQDPNSFLSQFAGSPAGKKARRRAVAATSGEPAFLGQSEKREGVTGPGAIGFDRDLVYLFLRRRRLAPSSLVRENRALRRGFATILGVRRGRPGTLERIERPTLLGGGGRLG